MIVGPVAGANRYAPGATCLFPLAGGNCGGIPTQVPLVVNSQSGNCLRWCIWICNLEGQNIAVRIGNHVRIGDLEWRRRRRQQLRARRQAAIRIVQDLIGVELEHAGQQLAEYGGGVFGCLRTGHRQIDDRFDDAHGAWAIEKSFLTASGQLLSSPHVEPCGVTSGCWKSKRHRDSRFADHFVSFDSDDTEEIRVE